MNSQSFPPDNLRFCDVFRGYGFELIHSNLLINFKQNLETTTKSQQPLRVPAKTKYLFGYICRYLN